MSRTFKDAPAVRMNTPLFIGLFAPTGGGKTFSALRLATGMQRITGGDIFAVDTESGRMLHYADQFNFRHVPFGAPYSPLDYRDAIDHCIARGAKTIIVDSATHEHEGEGGVIEWHDREVQRLMQAWRSTADKVNFSAWIAPKGARRKLIARMLQVNANVIFCFRAREKLQIKKGKDPVELGYCPIGAEELFFEMTCSALLLPTNKGTPVFTSSMPGEAMSVKLPTQFEALFGVPRQLDEDTGQKLAEWAAGKHVADPVEVLLLDYGRCQDATVFDGLEVRRGELWTKDTPADKKRRMQAASTEAKARVGAKAGKPDNAQWRKNLLGQSTMPDLVALWKSCQAEYQNNVPLEVEADYMVARERLSESEQSGSLTDLR